MSQLNKSKQSNPLKWIFGGIFIILIIILLVWVLFKKDDAASGSGASGGGASGGGCNDGEEMVGTKCLIKCTDGQIRVGEICQVETQNTLPRARYVKVERITSPYPDNFLNLGEIQVFDKTGKNIALRKEVTGGPADEHELGPFRRLTDGIVSGLVDGNYAHTNSYGEGTAYLQVDLGAVKEIAKVVITNRGHDENRNCCGNRLNNAKMILLDANNNIVVETEFINTTKSKIIYDFNVANPAWMYADSYFSNYT